MGPSEIGASSAHEQRLLEHLEDAAAELDRADEAASRAREARDTAVRAALKAGIPGGQIVQAASLSEGMVSRIRSTPGE